MSFILFKTPDLLTEVLYVVDNLEAFPEKAVEILIDASTFVSSNSILDKLLFIANESPSEVQKRCAIGLANWLNHNSCSNDNLKAVIAQTPPHFRYEYALFDC
jgi:hypothetical protein